MSSLERQFKAVTVGQKVTSFSKNPDSTLIAVGGREVFNLIELNPLKIKLTLRNRQVVSKGAGITYAVACTKWHPKDKSLISTISPSGAIVLWMLGDRPSSEYVEFHTRSGTSLSWSNFDLNMLFSSAQDAIVGAWDIRDFKGKPKMSVQFAGNNVCREVVCSPLRPNTLVVSTDGGFMKVYDTRKMTTSTRDICAHSSHFTIDWHPQVPDALCTGSNDHWLHVWELSRSGNDPLHKIQTIASVSRVQWRPRTTGTSTSFATTSMFSDQDIRVWDVNMPFAPVVCFKKAHAESIADIIWLTNDDMLSCSQDGIVKIQNIKLATPTHDKPNTCVAWLQPRVLITVRSSVVETRVETTVSPQSLAPTHGQFPSAPVPAAATEEAPVGLFRRLFPRNTSQPTPAPHAHVSPYTSHGESPEGHNTGSFPTVNGLPTVPSQRVRSVVEIVKVEHRSQVAFKKYAAGYGLPTMTGFESPERIMAHNETVAASMGDAAVAAMWRSFSVAYQCADLTLCADLLTSYVECFSDCGDVQQCSHIYVTMCAAGGVVMPEGYKERVFEWVMSYVEQLDHLRLNVVSTAIVRSARIAAIHDALRTGLMGGETFSVVCSCGGKASSGKRCVQCCTPMNTCAVCELETQGLFIWFRTCGHGGCVNHVTEWIQYCKDINEPVVCPKCATPLWS